MTPAQKHEKWVQIWFNQVTLVETTTNYTTFSILRKTHEWFGC